MENQTIRQTPTRAQNIARLLLGFMLLTTGTGHLSWARAEFTAQVPDWLPLGDDLVVILSGIAELTLGLSLVFLVKFRAFIGWMTALFFVVIFPGNIAQFVNHTDAFGLNSDLARGLRLLFQPVFVLWALWCTGAWQNRKQRYKRSPNT